MKFSAVIAFSALVLAATSEAAANSMLRAYNQANKKGACNAFPVLAYNTCYTVNNFYNMQSASYKSADAFNDNVSVLFFETSNCGGDYTRFSGKMSNGNTYSWGSLKSVNGKVGSIYVSNILSNNGEGSINQNLAAYAASWTGSC